MSVCRILCDNKIAVSAKHFHDYSTWKKWKGGGEGSDCVVYGGIIVTGGRRLTVEEESDS